MADDLTHLAALVTGASGFLGRSVVERLLGGGAFVVGVDERPWPGAAPGPTSSWRHVPASFDDGAGCALRTLEGSARTRRVAFHMAGLANAEECRRAPAAAFEANVALAFRVAELCRRDGVTGLALPSTGLVYGRRLERPALETDPPRPEGIYAGCKLAAEALVLGLAGNGFAVVVARLGNVYGPGASLSTAAGTAISQVLRGGDVVLLDPEAIRDFTFVGDVAEGLVRLLSVVESGGVTCNLSTGVGTSVRDLVLAACHAAGRRPAAIRDAAVATDTSPSTLVLDNSLLARLTGWRPSRDLPAGMAETVRGWPS